MTKSSRLLIIGLFTVLAAASCYFLFHLKFSFDFEQFFPENDEDLAFFQEFIKEFETDDNFMLIALRRPEGAFDQTFLQEVHDFALASRDLPYVEDVQSLTKLRYPIKTPFAITSVPAIHIDQPDRYDRDKQRLLQDERFSGYLISKDATALVVYLKVIDAIQLDQAKELMEEVDGLVTEYAFPEYYYLGRPYFQTQLVAMQKREITFSAIVSGILVCIIMIFLFRKPWGVGVALFSIGLGMLLFMGFMGGFGRELNAMSALYPVLMIIVGTSDVIHIMSKYIDELRKGIDRRQAIRSTIKEIGLATLLTSVTTAIGFGSLMTSRVGPIKDFGINSAAGVLIAYFTVVLFTTAVLSWFRIDQIIRLGRSQELWENSLVRLNKFTRNNSRAIAWGSVVTLGLSLWGISMISTNYSILNNLPRNAKISEDFRYFEKELVGFRPIEFAVFAQPGYEVKDYAFMKELNKLEEHLRSFPYVEGIISPTAVYKSVRQMFRANQIAEYQFPEDEATFERYQKTVDQIPQANMNVLVSKDGKKARISSKIADIGADSIKQFSQRVDRWAASNLDTTIVEVKQTGTGMIIDKNAEYIRANLLEGLGFAVIIVSLLMALLFQNWKMILISLIPNAFPLVMAGALLGFLGIELEAGISIVFAVVFGIAVDDTIHFLSKFKLARNKGKSVEESLQITFTETGKAIILTSIVLFFGFLIMLFSVHPPSVYVGLLISLTLFSAVVSDLLLIPVLIRWLIKDEPVKEELMAEPPVVLEENAV